MSAQSSVDDDYFGPNDLLEQEYTEDELWALEVNVNDALAS